MLPHKQAIERSRELILADILMPRDRDGLARSCIRGGVALDQSFDLIIGNVNCSVEWLALRKHSASISRRHGQFESKDRNRDSKWDRELSHTMRPFRNGPCPQRLPKLHSSSATEMIFAFETREYDLRCSNAMHARRKGMRCSQSSSSDRRGLPSVVQENCALQNGEARKTMFERRDTGCPRVTSR